MRPFFRYFGAKWMSARRYPYPTHSTVIEPFAGSAGYAIHFPERDVILVDADEAIAGVWTFLIGATPGDILALPTMQPGQSVDAFKSLSIEEKWFIGLWINPGASGPRKTATAWCVGAEGWTDITRRRIARQVPLIKHWKFIHGDYAKAPDVAATWFVDPPYQGQGKQYRHSDVNFERLALWCKARKGQVIVCENEGADWLPFQPSHYSKGWPGRRAAEVVWMRA